MLGCRITRLRTKEKKSELTNFERIASGTFKKKVEKIKKTEEKLDPNVQEKMKKIEGRSIEKNKLKSSSSLGKDDSGNKLKRLFSKQKKAVKEKERPSFLKRE